MNMTFSDRNKKEQKLMHLYEKTTESKIVYEGKIFKIKSNIFFAAVKQHSLHGIIVQQQMNCPHILQFSRTQCH